MLTKYSIFDTLRYLKSSADWFNFDKNVPKGIGNLTSEWANELMLWCIRKGWALKLKLFIILICLIRVFIFGILLLGKLWFTALRGTINTNLILKILQLFNMQILLYMKHISWNLLHLFQFLLDENAKILCLYSWSLVKLLSKPIWLKI